MTNGGDSTESGTPDLKFEREKNIQFFVRCLNLLPSPYCSLDPNRITLAFFSVSALDIMGALDEKVDAKKKAEIIDWVYAQQLVPKDRSAVGGFRGGSFLGVPFDSTCAEREIDQYDQGHIAMTYVALCLLVLLGDDFSRLDRKAVVASLKATQQPNGSFSSLNDGGSESDMRFLMCACVISHILNDWSGVDKDRAVQYVLGCQCYDGGIGLLTAHESHGGSTFCALAALDLMGRMDDLPHKQELIRWLVNRQVGGIQGRPGKDPDSCYTWWIGSSLCILDALKYADVAGTEKFAYRCQHKAYGGFGKYPDVMPDILHAFFSVAGLAALNCGGLKPMDFRLAISQEAASRIPDIPGRPK
eukprot:GFYU01002261.1.p1 GENE.GFYU01002261.1~~GFYU01002261.1.p1  ORF type:complete len:359 (+),score=48.29 GFYU01002261.1:137-1213(+)